MLLPIDLHPDADFCAVPPSHYPRAPAHHLPCPASQTFLTNPTYSAHVGHTHHKTDSLKFDSFARLRALRVPGFGL